MADGKAFKKDKTPDPQAAIDAIKSDALEPKEGIKGAHQWNTFTLNGVEFRVRSDFMSDVRIIQTQSAVHAARARDAEESELAEVAGLAVMTMAQVGLGKRQFEAWSESIEDEDGFRPMNESTLGPLVEALQEAVGFTPTS